MSERKRAPGGGRKRSRITLRTGEQWAIEGWQGLPVVITAEVDGERLVLRFPGMMGSIVLKKVEEEGTNDDK